MKTEEKTPDAGDAGNSELEEYQEFMVARSPLSEKVIYELSHSLFQRRNIRMISRLNSTQIKDVFNVMMVDKLFLRRYMNPKSATYSAFYDLTADLLELMISKEGKGRDDIREMVSGVNLFAKLGGAKDKITGK